MAEDCLPPKFFERLYWGKLSLKLDEAAVIADVLQTLTEPEKGRGIVESSLMVRFT